MSQILGIPNSPGSVARVVTTPGLQLMNLSSCILVSLPHPSLHPTGPLLTLLLVEPPDEAAIAVGFEQQLFEELPQVDGLPGA